MSGPPLLRAVRAVGAVLAPRPRAVTSVALATAHTRAMTRVYAVGVLALLGINLALIAWTGSTTYELARIADLRGEAGDEIAVDIIEPLYQSGEGEYSIYPGGRRPEVELAVPDPRMWRDLEGPFHLRGRIVYASERTVRVEALVVTPLELPVPVRIDPRAIALWDGHYVEFEDEYSAGFEASVLHRAHAWLDGVGFGGLRLHCEPRRDQALMWYDDRVLVRGFVHAHGSFGHLSGFDTQLAATHITYLDQCKPRICGYARMQALARQAPAFGEGLVLGDR
jgi:hypothetical protein